MNKSISKKSMKCAFHNHPTNCSITFSVPESCGNTRLTVVPLCEAVYQRLANEVIGLVRYPANVVLHSLPPIEEESNQ